MVQDYHDGKVTSFQILQLEGGPRGRRGGPRLRRTAPAASSTAAAPPPEAGQQSLAALRLFCNFYKPSACLTKYLDCITDVV